MPATRTRGVRPISSSAVLLSLFVFLAAGTSIVYATTPNARVDDPSRISVTAVAGDVDVTMAGDATDVEPESTVSLPARVVTGSDGMLGLTQAGTNITVAGDTDVEIPAEAVDGNLIARLVQHRGNVFYDVAHRDVGKLRVETPYLVAVIKGTQFNVAVQEDSTTISLFEGRLEIRTPDGSDVVQLNAGEIAIRSRTDGAIRVLGMNEERVETPRAAGRANDNAVAAAQADPTLAAVRVVEDTRVSASTPTVAANALPAVVTVDLTKNIALGERPGDVTLGGQPTVQIASGLDLEASKTVGLDTGASVDLGVANTDLGVNAGASLGVVTADVGLGANLGVGAATAGVSLDTGLSVGGVVAADVGLDTTVDLGGGTAGVSLGSGLGLGGVTADTSVAAGVDLGTGSIDVGVATGVDLGASAGVALDADVGLGLAGGTASATLGTGIDLGSATVDVGVATGVDLAGGTATVAVDLGPASIDLGIDTGGGLDPGITLGTAPDAAAPAGSPVTAPAGAPVVAPDVAPVVVPVIAPVVAPIVPVIAPIVAPVLGGGGLGALLGRP